ncbi:MAG: hypothetical protein ABFD50_18830 [Smithella sp.]
MYNGSRSGKTSTANGTKLPKSGNGYKELLEQGIPRTQIDEKLAAKMMLTGPYSEYGIKETIKNAARKLLWRNGKNSM